MQLATLNSCFTFPLFGEKAYQKVVFSYLMLTKLHEHSLVLSFYSSFHKLSIYFLSYSVIDEKYFFLALWSYSLFHKFSIFFDQLVTYTCRTILMDAILHLTILCLSAF